MPTAWMPGSVNWKPAAAACSLWRWAFSAPRNMPPNIDRLLLALDHLKAPQRHARRQGAGVVVLGSKLVAQLHEGAAATHPALRGAGGRFHQAPDFAQAVRFAEHLPEGVLTIQGHLTTSLQHALVRVI